MNEDGVKTPLLHLDMRIRYERYAGHDPYDFLNSVFSEFRPHFRFYFQQTGKFLPVNIRNLLGIPKRKEPKALAIISLAYLNMEKTLGKKYMSDGEMILEQLACSGKRGSFHAWGYTFPWQSRDFYLSENEPNIVVTAICTIAFIKYYERVGKKKYLDIAESASRYILNGLNRYETERDLCFSYTKYDHSRITDANLFAGAVFSALYRHTGDEDYIRIVEKIMNYTRRVLRSDGGLIYGYDSKGNEIEQLDYHQGFDILLMKEISRYTEIPLQKEILSSLGYYKTMFDGGRAFYRNKKKWPVDIHNQAQGILTFAEMSYMNETYINKSYNIFKWTIENMWDRKGYFYYQVWPFMKNRIPYMRWTGAWMLLAMSSLLLRGGDDSG